MRMILKYDECLYNLNRYCSIVNTGVKAILLYTDVINCNKRCDLCDELPFESGEEKDFAFEDLTRALQEGLSFYDLDQAIDQFRGEQE